MSWHYSLGPEVASWEGSCLDGAPFALSSLIPSHAPCCSPDNATASSSASPSGMTCEPSTGARGAGTSTSSAAGSHAKISARQASASASSANDRAYGLNSLASFARFDRASCSWKTPQISLLAGSESFSETWPRWGLMRAGACWELATPAHLIAEIAYGSWPTPTASMGGHGWSVSRKRNPTRQSEATHATVMAEVAAHGWAPSPRVIEWLMGWPQDWTALEPLETGKFRQWLGLHGRP